MCGITGWIDWEQDLTGAGPVIDAMTETLSSRGPDASGTWLSRHAALGHRRLVVVDPAGGGQPMLRRRGEAVHVLTYNGELYNTPELREQLLAKGYVFQGHSDTEVLLLSYIEWGPDCVDRFNGIFAFGIWSEADQRLFLARDRLGVKPLFYTERGQAFIFGSELKALLAHPAVPHEIDAEGLSEVFLVGPARTPGHGVFRGVRELRPGHCLLHDRNGTRVRRYWGLESRPHPDSLETTVAKVRDLLRDTVERQLVADVPVCTLLSGGLDSSAIAAFATAAFARRDLGALHTYSVDYEGNERHFRPTAFQPDADTPWIKLVSEQLGTCHHYVTITTAALAEALIQSMRARDLPGMADVDASLYLFCREVKREATVALSGESADEVFGGYPWFHREDLLHAEIFPWSRMSRARTGLVAPELQARFMAEKYVSRRYRETLAEVPRLPGEDPEAARLREISYLNLTWFLNTLLDRKDRMSMATGLEVRVPFCDHRLVEYVWNIPWDMKSCDDREKGLLRRALRGVLPEAVLLRRKSPYPKTHNPAYLNLVRDWLARILDDPTAPILPFLDLEAVRALLRTGGDGFSPAWFGQLMGGAQLFAYLIQVNEWLGEYRISMV
ncbi:MAG: asparagine synthase (glutamine-hydrolyzing) [Bacteroidota bacterium]